MGLQMELMSEELFNPSYNSTELSTIRIEILIIIFKLPFSSGLLFYNKLLYNKVNKAYVEAFYGY